MHLIYIDESGNTGQRRDPDQPLHMIAAVIVHETKVRAIEDAVGGLVTDHFPNAFLQTGFELHGKDLFSGTGFFKGVAPAARIAAAEGVMAVLEANEAKVGSATIDKMKLRSTNKHPHHLAFVLLAERLESFLKRHGSLGLIVADENKEVEQALIDDFALYKVATTGFGWNPVRLDHMIDSVHFVQSKNNRLIQCADLVAYFLMKADRLNMKLQSLYRHAPEPRPPWSSFRTANVTASEAALLRISAPIERMSLFQKVWPLE